MEDTGVLPPLLFPPSSSPIKSMISRYYENFKKRENPKEAPSKWKKSKEKKKQRGLGRWVKIIFVDVGIKILKVLRTLKK